MEGEHSPQGLRSRVVSIRAERNECYDLAKKATENFKTAETDLALKPSLRKAALEIDAHTAGIPELQVQLMAKSAKLLELCAENGKLGDKLSHAKAQNTGGGTVSDDLESVAGSCERPLRREKAARLCENPSTTPSTAVFSALLGEKEDYKNRCETSLVENHCIPGLAAEVKKLRKKLAECEKTDAASKSAPKRRKKRATAASRRLVALVAELPNARAAHSTWWMFRHWLKKTQIECELSYGICKCVVLTFLGRPKWLMKA